MSSPNLSRTRVQVPFFKPSLTETETQEVLDTLRSGWLTTGEKVKRFETGFAAAVGARNAVAVNSCTAALHLAVEALGLSAGQAVLVPTMTFAATAEVVRYLGAVPILVDCDPVTLNLNLEDAMSKIDQLRSGRLAGVSNSFNRDTRVVGIIPVHVGGMMMQIDRLQDFARQEGLWIVEDAAHAFPAAWRNTPIQPWQRCGEGTAAVSCFSFYANKTITTGEGGMAVTDNTDLASRMRMMSLHGLSQDAWDRYSAGGTWDYKIAAPGFKYNLTDIAASIGIHQLARAESMRKERENIARRYLEELSDLSAVELPRDDPNRIHSWHLFPIKLQLNRLAIDRNAFVEELKRRGVGCSVHWRPLHLHPYYERTFGWRSDDLPVATTVWQRLISLPLFPGMDDSEVEHVVDSVADICGRYAR
jgi:perosamine synthetase